MGPQTDGSAARGISIFCPSTRASSIRRRRLAKNPDYFDPENVVKLAVEGGCNAVASTFGVLGIVSRTYAHKIPFIVKINHNELLTYPNSFEQILFGNVEQAYNMGAAAVGATIYFGSDDRIAGLVESGSLLRTRTRLGMATILWCYLRNKAFKANKAVMLVRPYGASESSRGHN